MKYTLTALVAILSLSRIAVAHAQNPLVSVTAVVDTEVTLSGATSTLKVRGGTTTHMENNNEKSTTTQKHATDTKEKNEQATSTDNKRGKTPSEEHRSVVSVFVTSLLTVADRESGIGEQVRIVARSQNDSATTTATAINKVESRGSVRIFFFGSDYRNLGVIRSEIATTNANIFQLRTLLDKTTSDADRSELTVQIRALEDQGAKLNVYVTEHENIFSLFGWFNKLFVK